MFTLNLINLYMTHMSVRPLPTEGGQRRCSAVIHFFCNAHHLFAIGLESHGGRSLNYPFLCVNSFPGV